MNMIPGGGGSAEMGGRNYTCLEQNCQTRNCWADPNAFFEGWTSISLPDLVDDLPYSDDLGSGCWTFIPGQGEEECENKCKEDKKATSFITADKSLAQHKMTMKKKLRLKRSMPPLSLGSGKPSGS